MKTIIFSYIGPISGLQEALNECIEQSIGVCDFSGYCSSQCQYYGSGCETI